MSGATSEAFNNTGSGLGVPRGTTACAHRTASPGADTLANAARPLLAAALCPALCESTCARPARGAGAPGSRAPAPRALLVALGGGDGGGGVFAGARGRVAPTSRRRSPLAAPLAALRVSARGG
jgi:hypothetical protein